MNDSPDYNPLAAYQEPSLSDKFRALATDKGFRIYLLLALLLIAATIALYGRSVWNPLVFDDTNDLNEGLAGVAASPFALRPRWLTLATFGWTYALVGMDWFWHRVGNVALHALTVVLLFTFFLRLLDAVMPQPDPARQNRIPAFFGALLFAWHPVSVYGVAYLLQRSTMMATLFAIAALLCYLEGLTRGRARWFVGSLFCYLLALSSKEHVVMLPGVAIAISLLLRKPALVKPGKLWLPIAVLGGIGLAFVLNLNSRGIIGSAYEPTAFEIFSQMRRHGMGPTLDNAYPLSIITQGHLFFQYLLLWIVPYTGWMSIDVRQPFATHLLTWPQTVGFAAFLIYPIIAARFLLKGGKPGLLGLGMLFPWLLFLTEFATVRVSEIFVLYRSYLWMSGLPLIALALLHGVRKKTAAIAGVVVVCLALFPLAWNRLGTFSDEVRLWSDAIATNAGKTNQGAERGYLKRGFAYLAQGRHQDAIGDFKQAHALNSSKPGYADIGDRGVLYFQFNNIAELALERATLDSQTKAIELAPNPGEAYLKRGATWIKLERPDLAAEDFTRAAQANPKLAPEALTNRAKTHIQLGNAREALFDANLAIERNPKLAQAYMVRGTIRAMSGDPRAALDDLEHAARLDPTDAEIHFGLGNLYAGLQRYPESLQSYDKAIKHNSTLADAYANRGSIYQHLNRVPEALAEYEKALRAKPDHEITYLNRAKIYLAQSRNDEAMKDYERVLNLNHLNGEALLNRGILLLDQTRTKEARISFERSCKAGNSAGCDRLKEMAR